MGNNYSPWDIREEDFFKLNNRVDKNIFLLRFALLAPSSHNTQPWKAKVEENKITIKPEMKRSLPVGDENNRLMYISLGCFIENLIIAADYFGYEYKVIGATVNFGKLTLGQELRRNKRHLFHSIPKRVTNRGNYIKDLPDNKLLQKINQTEVSGVQLSVIENVRLKEKMADIVIRAGIKVTANKDFRHELSNHVKNNITSSKTGMPVFGYDIPTPLSFLAPLVIKHLNMNRVNHKKDLDLLINHSPLFILLSVKKDTQKYWIKAGRMYEKIALCCAQSGFVTHPMAAPIQIDNYFIELQKVLSTNYRPAFFYTAWASFKGI